jgi:hypothetical protein
MPLNIGGATIEGANNFRIKNTGGTSIFDRSFSTYNGQTFSKVIEPDLPVFVAGSASNPGWVNYATNNWAKVNNYDTTTVINNGDHYSTVNTRFTCPLTGPYLFIFTTYAYTAGYCHPQFAVNGGVSTRRYNTPYRIRQYGMVANYQHDMQLEEVIYCTAGDYVEMYAYSNGAGYHYAHYSLFQGIWVG